MRLEDLRPDLLLMDEDARMASFCAYCERRSRDLEETVVQLPKRAAKSKSKAERKIPVTPDQLKLLKDLGLI